jgi:hypothetical protein
MTGAILQTARTGYQDALTQATGRTRSHQIGDQGPLAPEERIDLTTIMRPCP